MLKVILPTCLGQVLVHGAKERENGVAEIGQSHDNARHTPQNTCCRQKQPYLQKGVQQASIHPTTQEHMELHLHQHFDTILTLPAACTKLQTTFSIGLEPQKRWFQKKASWNHRVFGQARVRTRGAGGIISIQMITVAPCPTVGVQRHQPPPNCPPPCWRHFLRA